MSNYEFQLSTVYWAKQELLMLGDEVGNVLTVDPRVPRKICQQIRVSHRKITDIRTNAFKQFGIVANNNVVTVLEINKQGELEIIHKHRSPVMNYAMTWDDRVQNVFYVVGEKKYAKKIRFYLRQY